MIYFYDSCVVDSTIKKEGLRRLGRVEDEEEMENDEGQSYAD